MTHRYFFGLTSNRSLVLLFDQIVEGSTRHDDVEVGAGAEEGTGIDDASSATSAAA